MKSKHKKRPLSEMQKWYLKNPPKLVPYISVPDSFVVISEGTA